MGSLPPANGAGRQYALVGYIPDPLGAFLQRLRAELVPGCRLLSHVTLLPPRELAITQSELVETLSATVSQIPSFELGMGDVAVFPSSNVVYLSIAAGRKRLQQLHHGLNSGLLEAEEPFAFHPHVTLAQDLPIESIEAVVHRARRAWEGWTRSRSFFLERLTLVRNVNLNHWEMVSEHPLRPRDLRRTA